MLSHMILFRSAMVPEHTARPFTSVEHRTDRLEFSELPYHQAETEPPNTAKLIDQRSCRT